MTWADRSKVRREIHLSPKDFASDIVFLRDVCETLIIGPLFSNWSPQSWLVLFKDVLLDLVPRQPNTSTWALAHSFCRKVLPGPLLKRQYPTLCTATK